MGADRPEGLVAWERVSRSLPDAARLFCRGAFVAQCDDDVAQATAMITALAAGARLNAFADPSRHKELALLERAVFERMEANFLTWVRRFEAPPYEVEAALAMFEANTARELPAALASLTPQDDGPATLWFLVMLCAAPNPKFTQDIVCRDIAKALVQAGQKAAHSYREPIRALALSPRPPGSA